MELWNDSSKTIERSKDFGRVRLEPTFNNLLITFGSKATLDEIVDGEFELLIGLLLEGSRIPMEDVTPAHVHRFIASQN